ncbi:MAG: site-2 protease family protein [Motilibacteraceae bacterium]
MTTPAPPAPRAGAPDQPPPDGPRGGAGGFLLGRAFGVPIVVTPAWVLVAALITWAYRPTVQAQVPGLSTPLAYVVAAAFALLLYLSVLVHELCHSVVAVRLGLPVRRITLHVLGGVSEIEKPPPTPGRSFAVAVVGPLVNLLLAVPALLLARAVDPAGVVHVLAEAFAVANLLVGGFNLLPGLPLDGGRLLEALVWRVTGRRSTGTLAAAWVGRVMAVVLVLVPLAVATAQDRQADLITVVWGALLGSFIWVGASQALASGRIRDRLPALSAAALARRAVPVARDLPVSEAVRKAQESGARALVVVDGQDRPLALVQEASVSAMPLDRRPWVPVADLARRLGPETTLSMHLAGEDLLAAVQRHPAPEYLLVDDEGLVYGVLALSDVEQVLAGR